ncbi:hypothetical protein P7K49_024520 [Saguinus oedipus]|uniref:Uncharacterized protein n=1 Tax=Saguinus oedipus TaxID=9490 RepID=A0ABQ9UQJ4_SAGOE|nr:hypothetical protein P7K49_024520 [Saguinus oedipus]
MSGSGAAPLCGPHLSSWWSCLPRGPPPVPPGGSASHGMAPNLFLLVELSPTGPPHLFLLVELFPTGAPHLFLLVELSPMAPPPVPPGGAVFQGAPHLFLLVELFPTGAPHLFLLVELSPTGAPTCSSWWSCLSRGPPPVPPDGAVFQGAPHLFLLVELSPIEQPPPTPPKCLGLYHLAAELGPAPAHVPAPIILQLGPSVLESRVSGLLRECGEILEWSDQRLGGWESGSLHRGVDGEQELPKANPERIERMETLLEVSTLQ